MLFNFDLDGLVRFLSTNRPTTRQTLSYVARFVWLGLVVSLIDKLLIHDPDGNIQYSPLAVAISGLIGSLLVLFGLAVLDRLYKSNGGDEGEFFLERLIAIGWVATFRASIFGVPVAYGVPVFFTLTVGGLPPLMAAAFQYVVLGAGLLYGYFAIADSLRAVHRDWRGERSSGGAIS